VEKEEKEKHKEKSLGRFNTICQPLRDEDAGGGTRVGPL
jgi:hypothetical protein